MSEQSDRLLRVLLGWPSSSSVSAASGFVLSCSRWSNCACVTRNLFGAGARFHRLELWRFGFLRVFGVLDYKIIGAKSSSAEDC
jgi:hypothetical protein